MSAPPPSSGGIVLAQSLKILENYELSNFKKTDRVHLIVEAMKKGYKDRAIYLGDPDFNKMNQKKLLSSDYISVQVKARNLTRCCISQRKFVRTTQAKGEQTTHFSIIDAGNIASVTLSINYRFGSYSIAGNTGVFVYNEMDDFSVDAGTPVAYGLQGLKPNFIERKTAIVRMTPTMVEDKLSKAILGTPGGSRIISMVLLAILEYRKGLKPDSWVSI